MELAMFSGSKSLHESNTHMDKQIVNGTKQKSTPSQVRAQAGVRTTSQTGMERRAIQSPCWMRPSVD